MPLSELDQKSINTIRFLAADAVQKANSGHPGLPMGAAVMAYTLFTKHLRFNPSDPEWINRDRFILSAGHGSMLIYALLHLTGYDLPLDEIQSFRQWGSITPGHPESFMTPGIETTTGPLGQGFANGVGMAIGERYLAERFNTPEQSVIDHHIYAIVSDGDLQEGVTAEAASYAGTQRLGKLIYLYDDNEISIEGNTKTTFREDVAARFRAYGWHVIGPIDGMNIDAVDAAIVEAKQVSDLPTLIVCRTTIGFGAPHKQGTAEAHGEPLGADELKAAKENLGWPTEPAFLIPGDVLEHFRESVERGQQLQSGWQGRFEVYQQAMPDQAAELLRIVRGDLPSGWEASIPVWTPDQGKVATRVAGGKVLNAIAKSVPELFGGSADLAPSTKTWLDGEGKFGWDAKGRNLQFGIREHAMGSMCVGISEYCAGLIPYGATFLVFLDYMRPPVRLAALSHKRVIFVYTHDSIALGEDGPTHQPIEQLAMMRATPNLWVMRPADANEVGEAWKQAILRKEGPTAIVLTRQNLPIFDRNVYAAASGVSRGAYVLKDSDGVPDVILIGTGSEVALCLDSAALLEQDGIKTRVVSMPCWDLFEEQPSEYQDEVLPPSVRARVAVEAASPFGWRRWVGYAGDVIGLDRFGASAPGDIAYRELGFNTDNVVARVKKLVGK